MSIKGQTVAIVDKDIFRQMDVTLCAIKTPEQALLLQFYNHASTVELTCEVPNLIRGMKCYETKI